MNDDKLNIKPELKNYPFIPYLRFWCQKVIPLTYDNSLSYYETLCKVVNYINNLISDDKILAENICNLLKAFNELQEFVNNYFSEYQNRALISYENLITNANYKEELPDCDTALMNNVYRLHFTEDDIANVTYTDNMPSGLDWHTNSLGVLMNFNNFYNESDKDNGYYDTQFFIYTSPTDNQCAIYYRYKNVTTETTTTEVIDGETVQVTRTTTAYSEWYNFFEDIYNQLISLNTKINNEIERATNREDEIEEKFDTEIDNLKATDISLNEKIETETQRAQSAETALDGRITKNSTDIADIKTEQIEQNERIEGLENRVNDAETDIDSINTNITNLDNKIDNEINRAQGKENELEEDIRNLQENITDIDNAIHDIETNISNNTNAIHELETRVDTLDSELEAETNRAQTKENELEEDIRNLQSNVSNIENDIDNINSRLDDNAGNIGNIDTEIENIKTDITNIENDINEINTNISDINTKIENEITRATNKENELENNITENAEDISALDERVTVLESASEFPRKVYACNSTLTSQGVDGGYYITMSLVNSAGEETPSSLRNGDLYIGTINHNTMIPDETVISQVECSFLSNQRTGLKTKNNTDVTFGDIKDQYYIIYMYNSDIRAFIKMN